MAKNAVNKNHPDIRTYQCQFCYFMNSVSDSWQGFLLIGGSYCCSGVPEIAQHGSFTEAKFDESGFEDFGGVDLDANALDLAQENGGGGASRGVLAVPPLLHGRRSRTEFVGQTPNPFSVGRPGRQAEPSRSNGGGKLGNFLGAAGADGLHSERVG